MSRAVGRGTGHCVSRAVGREGPLREQGSREEGPDLPLKLAEGTLLSPGSKIVEAFAGWVSLETEEHPVLWPPNHLLRWWWW